MSWQGILGNQKCCGNQNNIKILTKMCQLKFVNLLGNLGLTGNKMRPCYTSQQDPPGNKKMVNRMLISALDNSFYITMKFMVQSKTSVALQI